MDPITFLDAKDIIKKNMDICEKTAAAMAGTDNELIKVLAVVLHDTNSVLDQVLEYIALKESGL